MNTKRYRIFLATTLLVSGLGLAEEITPFTLKGGKGDLIVDAKGISLKPSFAACPSSEATGEPFWAIILQPDMPPPVKGESVVLRSEGQNPKYRTVADGICLTYENLTDGKKTWQVALTLNIRREGDAFEVTGVIRNDVRGWLVTGLTGPVLNGIFADLTTYPVLMPDGMGKRVNRVPKAGQRPVPWSELGKEFEIASYYPGAKGTMQWFAFAGQEGGLYMGCHDPLYRSKRLSLRYDPERKRFGMSINHEFFCAAGKSWLMPPVIIMPYEGTWHIAARCYREWVDSTAKLRDVPEWAKNSSGWLLCILKQQNGEVMWPYNTLDKLCDVADQRGLDILGLFGWANGGHDHLYPDYVPDPEMGGKEALKKALQEVRRRGKRSIIYANGQLQERDATEFWKKTGKDIAILKRDGETYQHSYHKYSNIPKYKFDLGCLYAQAWYDRMLSLALQANELGADGILYDQLAMMSPMACYGEGHGHPVPTLVHESERPGFLYRITEHMKKINPDFIVMTEGLHDCALDSISMFHGCELGTFHASEAEIQSRLKADRVTDPFPEMFRYTYPEVMTTVRVPTPMMDRVMANFTCVYGMRYEIESRYGPDVKYLLENKVPDVADYKHVNSKPDIGMMKAIPPEEATRYLKKIIEFRRANADLLLKGHYTDSEGFSFKGDELIAKGFESGSSFGVVVWNPGDKTASFKLNVPDSVLVSASDPEHGKVEAFSDMPQQSVRLLVWKKQEVKKQVKTSHVEFFEYRDCLRLENTEARVTVCPQAGGRVLEYAWRGQNALYLDQSQQGWLYKPDVKPIDPCGGRLDIGPERVITPHRDLWLGDWTGEFTGDGKIRLTSKRDGATGIKLVREFTLAENTSRFVCEQRMINESDKPVTCCHWSRTLAVGGGIVLIPLTPDSRFPKNYIMYGPGPVMNYRPEDPNIRIRDGFLEILGTPLNPKLGIDSYTGWFVYLMRNDLMFVKRFPVYPDRVYSEMAGLTISIWYFKNEMCELEPIGPREVLVPGASASYAEEWELVPYKFPADGQTVDLTVISKAAMKNRKVR